MPAPARFPIRVTPLLRPLLWIYIATARRTFVEVDGAAVRIRFGFFDERVPREDIASFAEYDPPWWTGWGLRWIPGHVLALGAHGGVVSFQFVRSRRMRLLPLLPPFMVARRVSVSMEDPRALIDALR
jgi:hypothetical protein